MTAWLKQAHDFESYARAAERLCDEYAAEGNYARAARYQEDAAWYRSHAAMYRARHTAWVNREVETA